MGALKISPCLIKLINLLGWKDCYRTLHHKTTVYSRYYKVNNKTEGARLDRVYQWGDIKTSQFSYKSISFSDHLATLCSISLPSSFRKFLHPKASTPFKVPPHVVDDTLFKALIQEKMHE